MSHRFQAKGGTVFNFNSDLSGPVSVRAREAEEGETHVPGVDLLEFVDWWRREYLDAEDAPTEQELKQLEWECSDEDDAPDGPSASLVKKLLTAYRQQNP